MSTKLIVLLGGVGAVHLAAGALFIAGGCTQEDPPMPPGIYVPKQPAHNAQANPEPVSAPESAGQADIAPAAPAPEGPAPDPVVKQESQDTVYIVVKNDSLWLIARKNGLTIEELASYNSLSPKTKVRIGQKLRIPPTGKRGVKNAPRQSRGKAVKPAAKADKTAAKPVRKSSAKASEKLPADGIYTVRERDSFSIIAKRFGIKVSDIIAANPGVDSSRLKIGQKLRLTAGAAPLPKSKANKARKRKGAAKRTSEKTAAKTKAAPSAETAAPAASGKSDSESNDDPEALLNSVKQPQENPAQDKKSNAAPQTSNFRPDKDRMVSGRNGQLSVVIGEDTSLTKFCRKFTVSEHVIRRQNKNIPASGLLKAGTNILLIESDDVI